MTKKAWRERKKQLFSKMKAAKDSPGPLSIGNSDADKVEDVNCGLSGQASSSAEVPLPLMLIVGPRNISNDLAQVFEEMMIGVDGSKAKIRFKTAGALTVEDALKWREDNLVSILFVVDITDDNAKGFLNNIHQTLATLCMQFQMSMDCIDFIVARDEPQRNVSESLAFDLLAIAQTYGRPLSTVVFENGWKDDKDLRTHLEMFLGRFRVGH